MICEKCWNKFSPIWITFMNSGFSGLAIYQYDEFMKENLYDLKVGFDIELSGAFLCRMRKILKTRYLGYTIVPIPSWHEDDEKRGFNHVVEIFKHIRLPTLKCLYKKNNHKQSAMSQKQREYIKDIIGIKENNVLTNKKILLVDDVYTTGSTISAAIKLIKTCRPKDVKILVLSMNCRKMTEKSERK